jgi:LysM repeat protein
MSNSTDNNPSISSSKTSSVGVEKGSSSTPSPSPTQFIPTKIKRDIDIKAEEAKSNLTLPKPPGRQVTFEQLVEWIALLTQDMLTAVDIYVYRVKPAILKEPKYIEVLKGDANLLTKDYMIKNHGGGDFTFHIYDRADKTTADRTIFGARLSIPINEVDPILDYETLDVHDRKNVPYVTLLKQKGIIDKDGKVVTATNTAKESMEGMGGVIQTILGFVEKMNVQQQQAVLTQLKGMLPQQPVQDNTGIKEFIPLFLEKMKQENPGNQMQGMMSMFSSLLASVKEMNPVQQQVKSNDGISMKEILEMNNKHNETVMQLIQQIIAIKSSGGGKETDPLEMVEKVLNIKDRLENSIGGKNVPQDKWDRIIDLGERILPVVFENVGAIIQARMTGGLGLNVGGTGTTPGKPKITRDNVNPYNNPNAAKAPEGFRELPAASTSSEETTKPKPGLVEIPNQDTSNETMQQIAAIIIQFGDYIINSLRNGQAGYEFADTIANLPGVGIVPMQLIGQYGITETVELCKKIQDQQGKAIFWDNVKHLGEQYVTKWLSDFVNFQEILDKMEGEEEEEENERNNPKEDKINKN